MVRAATTPLAEPARRSGRPHIGQSFGRSGDGPAIVREEIEESRDFVSPRGR